METDAVRRDLPCNVMLHDDERITFELNVEGAYEYFDVSVQAVRAALREASLAPAQARDAVQSNFAFTTRVLERLPTIKARAEGPEPDGRSGDAGLPHLLGELDFE